MKWRATVSSGSRVTSADFRDRTTLQLVSILDANRAGGGVSRPMILPGRSLVVVEPLRDPGILHALSRSPDLRASGLKTTVTLAGFPAAAARRRQLESSRSTVRPEPGCFPNGD